jgi:hypothetical protein
MLLVPQRQGVKAMIGDWKTRLFRRIACDAHYPLSQEFPVEQLSLEPRLAPIHREAAEAHGAKMNERYVHWATRVDARYWAATSAPR